MSDLSLSIPLDIRTPGQYIEIDASQAVGTLPTQERRVLIMGQRLSTGTVAAGVPTLITRTAQAETYFGRGSLLARMCAALFGTVGQYREIWAVALADASSGVMATKTLTFTGPASEAGTLALYLAGVRVAVAVSATETAAAIATAVAAAVNAETALPVTAAVGTSPNTHVVTLTARNAGECGQSLDVRHSYYMGEALPAGVGLTIAAVTAGTGNPDVADAIAAIGDVSYASIVMPWTDSANLATLHAELESRWGPMQQRTGHAFGCLVDTHANLITAGDGLNSPHLSLLGIAGTPTWAPEVAAILAGVCEYYGSIDPARPLQALALPGLLAPLVASRFTRTERDLLLHHGISTCTWGADGTAILERVITTYQETGGGVADISLLNLETKWTVDYFRYAVRATIARKFPRHKLADDGTRFAPGQAVATPRLIRAELLALFRDLEEAGLVERFDDFKAQLLVVRSTDDPDRVDALIPPNVVNQFRVFAAAVQFRL